MPKSRLSLTILIEVQIVCIKHIVFSGETTQKKNQPKDFYLTKILPFFARFYKNLRAFNFMQIALFADLKNDFLIHILILKKDCKKFYLPPIYCLVLGAESEFFRLKIRQIILFKANLNFFKGKQREACLHLTNNCLHGN